MATATPEAADIDILADRTVGYLAGAAVSAAGDQLGLYRALAEVGPAFYEVRP